MAGLDLGLAGPLVLGRAATDGVGEEYVSLVRQIEEVYVGFPQHTPSLPYEGTALQILGSAGSLTYNDDSPIVFGIQTVWRECGAARVVPDGGYAYGVDSFMEVTSRTAGVSFCHWGWNDR